MSFSFSDYLEKLPRNIKIHVAELRGGQHLLPGGEATPVQIERNVIGNVLSPLMELMQEGKLTSDQVDNTLAIYNAECGKHGLSEISRERLQQLINIRFSGQREREE